MNCSFTGPIQKYPRLLVKTISRIYFVSYKKNHVAISFVGKNYKLNMRSISDLKAGAIVSNIRKIREFRNYTQDYLAAKLNISQNAYSKIELGYSSITLNRLIQIAAILEIELADLIKPEFDVLL